ncbi:MAG: hypothetical protein LBL95_01405, partial [Deltaproteobacteria bacterium]|nr:hypothetical protein [Deltaproteobacteria bacterium]
DGPFIRPCQDFSNILVASYRGRILASEEVLVEGFGFRPEGLVTTDQEGRIEGTIRYTLDDLDYHNQKGGAYFLTINGVTMETAGPKATNFTVCGRP